MRGEERSNSDALRQNKTLLLVLVSQDQTSLATWEVPRLGRSVVSPPGPAVSEVKVHSRSRCSSGIFHFGRRKPKLLAVALVCDPPVH